MQRREQQAHAAAHEAEAAACKARALDEGAALREQGAREAAAIKAAAVDDAKREAARIVAAAHEEARKEAAAIKAAAERESAARIAAAMEAATDKLEVASREAAMMIECARADAAASTVTAHEEAVKAAAATKAAAEREAAAVLERARADAATSAVATREEVAREAAAIKAATLEAASREAAAMIERARADAAATAAAATAAAASAAAAAGLKLLQQLCEIRITDLKFDTGADGFPLHLGSGGFGTVFAGTFCGERVAIKKLPAVPAVDHAFWDEVSLHVRASHRHVVRVLGAAIREREDTGEMECFIVMERAVTDVGSAMYKSFRASHPAARLQRLVTEQPFRLRLLLEIARGLRFLHAKGIVHADLKPENVMLDADGHAQLTDFGMSVQRRLDATRTRTREWGRGGTPVYMDPAFSCGTSSVKPASDVYAWGVLAWELLTLRKPHDGLTGSDGSDVGTGAGAGAGARADGGADTRSPGARPLPGFSRCLVGGERPADVLAAVPGLPTAVRTLVVRCWAEEQGARPSAEDVVAVLERVVEV
ncbi:MAG: hypothetical protein EOO41_03135 [Methanobacteriota archaeon]|nr:MAG: hypothetical protein EOO41_03135 [Euryarchaeota archaeon]